jgi:alcohol dehydrogenase YqhD (iron-dependent ADH family)
MSTNSIATGVAYKDPEFDMITLSTGLVQILALSIAITDNVTTTTAPANSLAVTSNATGTGKLWMSDGSKWQQLAAI